MLATTSSRGGCRNETEMCCALNKWICARVVRRTSYNNPTTLLYMCTTTTTTTTDWSILKLKYSAHATANAPCVCDYLADVRCQCTLQLNNGRNVGNMWTYRHHNVAQTGCDRGLCLLCCCMLSFNTIPSTMLISHTYSLSHSLVFYILYARCFRIKPCT